MALFITRLEAAYFVLKGVDFCWHRIRLIFFCLVYSNFITNGIIMHPVLRWGITYRDRFFVCRHVSIWGFQNRVCPSVCLYPEKRYHHSFVNISPTLIIDTSMERSSRVLQHGTPKIWICFKKFKIEFWLVFWLVLKSWNQHSSGSQHAPICRHRGCIVVPLSVDI